MMMELGYLAAGSGFKAEAESIFEAVQVLRPDSEMPVIGLAVVKIASGQPLEAVSLLERRALRIDPDSALARSFLGLALRLAGHGSRSHAVLEEVAAAGDESEAVTMARSLLAEPS
jgi:predicted Zn-dependent protease